MANPSSIEDIQDAEAKAKKLIEDAENRKAEKIAKANEKAKKIVEDAEMKAKEIKDDAVKKAGSELDKERERKLSDARSIAKKIQSNNLSGNAVKNVVAKLVRNIFS